MKRRTFLATASGIGICGSLAGCLERDLSTTPLQGPESFDRCPRWRIQIANLPTAAREEVEAAIEEGVYEATPPLYLPNVLDPEDTHLITTDPLIYYRASVDHDGDVARLSVDRTVPTKGSHELSVKNDSETQLDFELLIDLTEPAVSYAEVETPERVLAESLSIDPGATVETSAFDRVYGEYELTVVTDDHTETTEFSERHVHVGSVTEIELDRDDHGIVIDVFPLPVRDDVVCDRWWYGDMPS
ncbi:MAG: hypothetical protein PPP58_06610 [Natronomonas sp.]